jgi:hypothetical protein
LQQARKSFGMHLQRHPRQPSFHDLQVIMIGKNEEVTNKTFIE